MHNNNISKNKEHISPVEPIDAISLELNTSTNDVSPSVKRLPPAEPKTELQSTLHEESSQSLSPSSMIKSDNSMVTINAGISGNHKDVELPKDDSSVERVRGNLNEKQLKLMKNLESESRNSTVSSTHRKKITPKNDTNFKAGRGFDQTEGTDDRSTDFSKPIAGMLDLSSTRKGVPRELDVEDDGKVLASRQVPIRRSKNTKVCWKWRKGRCHYGEKCWFVHSGTKIRLIRRTRVVQIQGMVAELG